MNINDCNVKKEELLSFLETVDKDFPVPLSEKQNLAQLSEKLIQKADIFAKRIDGVLAGVAIGYITNSTTNLSFLSIVAVKKEFRGLGISKEVVSKYLQEVKKSADVRRLIGAEVYTKLENKIAVQMYKDLGFVLYKPENEPRPNDLHLIYHVKEN